MVTSAADLGDHQTKPNNAYLPLHDIPFWKSHTKDNAMVTSAADLGDLCSWSWWPLQLIMVTSKYDLQWRQPK